MRMRFALHSSDQVSEMFALQSVYPFAERRDSKNRHRSSVRSPSRWTDHGRELLPLSRGGKERHSSSTFFAHVNITFYSNVPQMEFNHRSCAPGLIFELYFRGQGDHLMQHFHSYSRLRTRLVGARKPMTNVRFLRLSYVESNSPLHLNLHTLPIKAKKPIFI